MRTRVLLTAVAGLAAAATIAACGSNSPTTPTSPARSTSATGSTSPTGSGSSSSGSTLAFSKCMRANGLPTFPDLNSRTMQIEATRGPNGQAISVNGVSVNVPAFEAARRNCQKYLPHGNLTPAQTAQGNQRDLRFAKCMRGHGVPNFPDPKVISRSGGNEQVFLPGIVTQSPAFQAAAKACGFGPKGP